MSLRTDASVETWTLGMHTVELIGNAYEPAANCAPPGWCAAPVGNARSRAARGFLIQLVGREIQINEHCATWLREIAGQLESLAEPGSRAGAEACELLAARTHALRAELVVLIHRLVARYNRVAALSASSRRRVDVFAILAQPRSLAVVELVDLHQRNLASAQPWISLAALRPVEQMLAGMVPLAIDVAGVEDGDLDEAAELFDARAERASILGSVLTNLVACDARRAASVRAAEEQAIALFTRLLSECAEIGQQLDSWRHGFVR